jgi:folate-binding protein YgfZ
VLEASLLEQRLARESAALFDRSYRGIADLAGKTAPVDLLHKIFSSNVKALAPGEGQPSCFLSAKGRLLAAFHLHALPGGEYRIVFLEPLHAPVMRSLEKYCFLSDVSITDRGPALGMLSIEGPAALRALEISGLEGELPSRPLGFREAAIAGRPATVVRGGESPEGGFDLWVERGALETVRDALSRAVIAAGGGAAGADAAETLRIEAGIAHREDYGDDAFPSEVGWEHALTFDKCYVGQEIVARMKTYGHANRRLEGLVLPPGEPPPSRGALIRAGEEEVGKVTSAAVSDRLGRAVALGMVHRKAWGAPSLSIDEGGRIREAESRELPLVRASSKESES